MWLLDAWANAEKISYPVVWEEVKDADNVIDYDIRDEQTKDVSAEINANNQTTTGMANVIPWVNAPKLLESTSIISAPRAWYISASFEWSWDATHEPWWQEAVYDYVITNQVGSPQYTVNWSEITIPAEWTYQLDITYPEDWSFHYRVTRIYDTNSSWMIVTHTGTTWALHRDTETVVHEFRKWAKLYAICEYHYTWSGSWAYRKPTLNMTVTRLW